MPDWRALLRHTLARRPVPEVSHVLVGATGSGKSEAELVDLVRIARRGDHAVVLLDGHGPLAARSAGHWAVRGHEHRLVYEPLAATDRVLCWDMLPRSTATKPSQQQLENAEIRDEVAQCFLAARSLGTLNDRPWTKEWLDAAIALGQAQPRPEPLSALPAAFQVGTPAYERLLGSCTRPDVERKFRDSERLRRKNESQYAIQTGAARRLLELVCSSEVVRLRCVPGPFDWLEALKQRRLIAVDGGGIRTRELKRTLFLLAALQVTGSVRRHFAATQTPLPVVLVLEEAGALDLVAPFVVDALRELRKAGLSIHLITQSSLDFGDRAAFEAVLANVPRQHWFQSLTPADQELGARALANATFDAKSVHFRRTRVVPEGRPAGHRLIPRLFSHYKSVEDEFYKTPQVHEQEFRTHLATLKIGECLVRDREGVRRQRVRLLRAPRGFDFDASTHEAIARVRQQPLYVAPPPEEPLRPTAPSAAERLRKQADGQGETPTSS